MVYILWFCLVGVEIEMKHRVPTFSIPTQCNREVQVCVPYLFFTLFLRVRDVWFRRCLSDIRAQTSGGNSDWKLCGVVPCSWCGISCVILLRLCCWIKKIKNKIQKRCCRAKVHDFGVEFWGMFIISYFFFAMASPCFCCWQSWLMADGWWLVAASTGAWNNKFEDGFALFFN